MADLPRQGQPPGSRTRPDSLALRLYVNLKRCLLFSASKQEMLPWCKTLHQHCSMNILQLQIESTCSPASSTAWRPSPCPASPCCL